MIFVFLFNVIDGALGAGAGAVDDDDVDVVVDVDGFDEEFEEIEVDFMDVL